MREPRNNADTAADTRSVGAGAGPLRLCEACADPKRPLERGHGNVRFHADCYDAYRRSRNAQYKRAARRRADIRDDYDGAIMTVRSVTLPGRVVMELTALASRLQDQARLLSAESVEIMDVDAPARMVALADRILSEAEAIQEWLMDRLPQPVVHNRGRAG